MMLYKLFYDGSASGALDMVELRRAISDIPMDSDFVIAVFLWAIPVGRGEYSRYGPDYKTVVAPFIAAKATMGAAIGLDKKINAKSVEIISVMKAV